MSLTLGSTFTTPPVEVTRELAEELIRIGGYTHPLFADPEFIPGQAVLLLLGGLAEQTNRFDETVVAMLGMNNVRFLAPARIGDTLTGTVEVTDEQTRNTTRTLTMRWSAHNQDDQEVASYDVEMLFRLKGDPV